MTAAPPPPPADCVLVEVAGAVVLVVVGAALELVVVGDALELVELKLDELDPQAAAEAPRASAPAIAATPRTSALL
ncbi:MAG: hypothetical protein JOZ98_16535 [Solirubrobacterales bacterium]|nr:hypothetical protein [Solirubrobacterales bacterium]